MNPQMTFKESRALVAADTVFLTLNMKPKKRRALIVALIRKYRQKDHLTALCCTLILWRSMRTIGICLDDPYKNSKILKRMFMRSFHFLLQATSVQDISFLEHLLTEAGKKSSIHLTQSLFYMLTELRMLDIIIHSRAAALSRLERPGSYSIRSEEQLKELRSEICDQIPSSFGQRIQGGPSTARPV